MGVDHVGKVEKISGRDWIIGTRKPLRSRAASFGNFENFDLRKGL
jgi:hypothetical protein